MLGARIRALRRAAGMNQKELGEKLGVSASTIGMYEQGRREPSADRLISLAALLGTSPDGLLLGKPSEEAEKEQWEQDTAGLFSDAVLVDDAGARRPAREAAEALLSSLPDTDEEMMRRALVLAREAAAEGETPVGCVIARGGEIVGEGRNRREQGKNALAHAEIEAIAAACKNRGGWRLWDCTLYVTLEPCPMCAGAIINARIPRVVYGAKDAKAGSCGSVCDLFSMPFNHHPHAEAGLLGEECAVILRDFFRELRKKRARR